MQIYLSGVVRSDHLEVVSHLNHVGVVIDFSFKEMRGDGLGDLLRHFKSRGMPLIATHSKASQRDEEDYYALVRRHLDEFDLVHLNVGDVPNEFRPKSLVDAASLEDVEALIGKVNCIGIGKAIKVPDLKAKAAPLLPVLRAQGTTFHAWGKVDKEAVSSGLFSSASSPSWVSGSRYGNTYEYVGNLKMTTHHGSKGRGKSVRLGFSAKCAKYGVDYDRLISDDLREVNLWNALQWDLYSKDASLVGGYWKSSGDVDVTDKKTKPIQVGMLGHELALPQKRELASHDAGARYLRSCDSCFLSSSCPAYEPQSSCKISTRPKVDSPEDIQDLLNRIIEIQGERVMFAAFAEKAQNMGANPDVAKEMETLTKLVKDTKEIFSTGGDEVTIRAKGSGVISKIFGSYGRGGGGGSKPSQSENIIDVSPLERDDD